MKIVIESTDKKRKVQSDAQDPLQLMAVLSLTLVDAGVKLGYSREQIQDIFAKTIRRRYE
ncbi:MAG: hypothetical protein EOL98_15965 [Negativicutes bacterium]|nr:hypothetical protein [Negativicutes bacterium]